MKIETTPPTRIQNSTTPTSFQFLFHLNRNRRTILDPRFSEGQTIICSGRETIKIEFQHQLPTLIHCRILSEKQKMGTLCNPIPNTGTASQPLSRWKSNQEIKLMDELMRITPNNFIVIVNL